MLGTRLVKAVLLIIGTYFLFAGLSKASGFLLPIIFALLFSMLMLPVAIRLERWGFKRGWVSLVCVLIIMSFFVGLFFLVSAQVSQVSSDFPQIKQQVQTMSEQVVTYLEKKTGISIKDPVNQLFQQTGNLMSSAKNYFTKVIGFLGNALLVMVYTFFFLLYRKKFKQFLLKMADNDERMQEVIHNSSKIAQQYLMGRVILIIMLTVMYSIGLTIVGIEHAIIISLLAAVLSIIPYIGNTIAAGLAAAIGLMTGGGLGTALGVIAVFAITQFIDTYLFEPYILGHEVDLDPLWTIIFVVLGGIVWGIGGMVVAIPLMGIVKVVMDHVGPLQPYGWLIGEDKEGGNPMSKVSEKIKDIFKK